MFANQRSAYVNASLETASPARLLVMLLDRLVLDVKRAMAAQQSGNRQEKHRQLVHAQDIVTELRLGLDEKGFEGAADLAALYDYLCRRLVEANVKSDGGPLPECLVLSNQLAETWRQAAAISMGKSA